MKKTIIAIALALLLIINIVFAVILFSDIQAMTFPQTTIRVDVIEINADEMILHHDLQLYNPNYFEIILQNFQIVAITTTGQEVTNITIDGGSIPGRSNRSFAANDRFIMDDNLSEVITSSITGIIGVNILGIIKKTIPLKVTVITSLQEALKNISIPTITVRTEFENITRDGVNLSAEINVTNSNPFDFTINNFILNITTETGTNVGNFIITGSEIPAETSVTLHGSGNIIIKALDAQKLVITLYSEVRANVAGITKSLPILSRIEVTIPDLNEFIPPDKALELELKPDLQLAVGGIKSNMTLEAINPTKIPFYLNDIVVLYYGVTNDQKYYISKASLGSGEYVPESTTFFYGETILLYSKLLNLNEKEILPDWIFAQLKVNVSLSGTYLSIPISIGTYVDLQPFRPTK